MKPNAAAPAAAESSGHPPQLSRTEPGAAAKSKTAGIEDCPEMGFGKHLVDIEFARKLERHARALAEDLRRSRYTVNGVLVALSGSLEDWYKFLEESK